MQSLVKQLHFIEKTIVQLFDEVNEQTWKEPEAKGLRSVFELCHHMTYLPKADLMLASSASHQGMDAFYQRNRLETICEMKQMFIYHMKQLYAHIECMSECEKQRESTSYWGATYTQQEWILEILMHLIHHRAQLYQLLMQHREKPISICLFQ